MRLLPPCLVGLGILQLEGGGGCTDAAGAGPARMDGVAGRRRLPVKYEHYDLRCLELESPPYSTDRASAPVKVPPTEPPGHLEAGINTTANAVAATSASPDSNRAHARVVARSTPPRPRNVLLSRPEEEGAQAQEHEDETEQEQIREVEDGAQSVIVTQVRVSIIAIVAALLAGWSCLRHRTKRANQDHHLQGRLRAELERAQGDTRTEAARLAAEVARAQDAETRLAAAVAAAATAASAADGQLRGKDALLAEQRQLVHQGEQDRLELRAALERAQGDTRDESERVAVAVARAEAAEACCAQMSGVAKEHASDLRYKTEAVAVAEALERTKEDLRVNEGLLVEQKERAEKAEQQAHELRAALQQAECDARARAAAAAEADVDADVDAIAPAAAASVGHMAALTTPDPWQQGIFWPPSPNQQAAPPSSWFAAATSSDTDECETPGTEPAWVGQECVELHDGEGDPIESKRKPLISGLVAWTGRSMKIGIDDDGDCYPCSWVLSILLWAVQTERALDEFEKKLLEHDQAGGAFSRIPCRYQPHVQAFLEFVADQRKAWGQRRGRPQDFGVQMVERVIEALRGPRASAVGGDDDDAEAPPHVRIKWGMGLVGRAIDVHWAFYNTFPGNLNDLATICRSVEYGIGAESLLGDKEQQTDVMRPACGLGFVLGMKAEFVLASGEDRTEDYSEAFVSAAKNGPATSQVEVNGFCIVKGGLNHYDVRLQKGILAEHLAKVFKVNLGEGDEQAKAQKERNAEWAKQNAKKPDLDKMFSPEQLADARKEEERLFNLKNARAEDTTGGKELGPSAAAAAASFSSASSACGGKERLQTMHDVGTGEAYVDPLQKVEEDHWKKVREQDAATEKLICALVKEDDALASGETQSGGKDNDSDGHEWTTVPGRNQGQRRGTKKRGNNNG